LPHRIAGGQVTGPAGSEALTGSTGSVTSTGHSGEPPDFGLVPGPDGSPPEGPLSLIPTRALHLFPAPPRPAPPDLLSRRGRGRRGPRTHCSAGTELVWTTPQQGAAAPVEIVPGAVDGCGMACGWGWGNVSATHPGPPTPWGGGVLGRRTPPTHSLRGERDRSETMIRSDRGRLAGPGRRRPGDGVCGIGGDGWIDRERHRYRSPR
jgi:hypothetical protein